MRYWLTLFVYLFFIPPAYADIEVKKNKKGVIVVSDKKMIRKKKSTRGGIVFTHKFKSYNYFTQTSSRYLPKLKNYARKYGIREDLVIAVAKVESDFNPTAVSRKGAVGVMQLMKSTAKIYGVKNRYDANQNIKAGIKHLNYLFRKYKRNIPLTLAAYNAGENAVKKYKGVPPFKETINYIKKVMRFMNMGYNGNYSTRMSARIYKYINKDGNIIISDKYPSHITTKVEIID